MADKHWPMWVTTGRFIPLPPLNKTDSPPVDMTDSCRIQWREDRRRGEIEGKSEETTGRGYISSRESGVDTLYTRRERARDWKGRNSSVLTTSEIGGRSSEQARNVLTIHIHFTRTFVSRREWQWRMETIGLTRFENDREMDNEIRYRWEGSHEGRLLTTRREGVRRDTGYTWGSCTTKDEVEIGEEREERDSPPERSNTQTKREEKGVKTWGGVKKKGICPNPSRITGRKHILESTVLQGSMLMVEEQSKHCWD